MIENNELRYSVLAGLLGEDDDRLPRLINAEPRCLEKLSFPCSVCGVQDQIRRTQRTEVAQEIANICCPDGKLPVALQSRMALATR